MTQKWGEALSLSGWPDEEPNELDLILLMIYWEFLFPIIKSYKTVFTHFQMLWMSQRYEYIGTKKPRLSLSTPFFYFSQFYLSKEKEIYSDFYDLCLLTHLKVGEFTLHLSKLLIKEKWEGSKQTWRGHVKIKRKNSSLTKRHAE